MLPKNKKKSMIADLRERTRYYLFGPNLEKDERIIFIARRHPFLMLKQGFFILTLFFLIPIFFWFVFPELWMFFVLILVVGFNKLNRMVFNWYYDVIMVTNISLMDIKWNGPFERESIRLEYSMIEGVSINFKGYLQTIFNYGTLQVNRQGGGVGVALKDCMNPGHVESVIMAYQEKFLSETNLQEVNSLKNLLSELVKRHVQENKEIDVEF